MDRVEMKNRQEAEAAILPALSQLLQFPPRGVYSKYELRDLNLPNYQNPADLRLPLDLPRRAPARCQVAPA